MEKGLRHRGVGSDSGAGICPECGLSRRETPPLGGLGRAGGAYGEVESETFLGESVGGAGLGLCCSQRSGVLPHGAPLRWTARGISPCSGSPERGEVRAGRGAAGCWGTGWHGGDPSFPALRLPVGSVLLHFPIHPQRLLGAREAQQQCFCQNTHAVERRVNMVHHH